VGDAAVLRVHETRAALARLGAAFYRVRRADMPGLRLIGVTGTNGKTTVNWMLRSILGAARQTTALLGTIEYDLVDGRIPAPLTTPDAVTLCRYLASARDAGAECAVLEVSSHALAQARCDGLAFAAGVFTNLSGDHLDYHGDMEAYYLAKRRLFTLLEREGVAVVNIDDSAGERLARELSGRVCTFGLDHPHADATARVDRMGPDGSEVRLRVAGTEFGLHLPLIGGHNVSNALAAATTAAALGIENAPIVAGLERLEQVPGRMQRVNPLDAPFTVLVDYAHTDAALRSAISAVRPLTDGRLICVFGCGGDRDRSKRPRMAAAASRADIVFVTSDNPRTEDPDAIINDILAGFNDAPDCRVFVDADRGRAIEAAIGRAEPGDCVLIAGKGHETYQLVGERVLHFDDSEVASRSLAQVLRLESPV
jgi:UDP-N-acetylmuramoyl-L-alanyl-D-glutamate--2,6-diaminopimelate ligase